jgi:predicted transglutaminase-like cysteine proteinase
MFKNLAFVAILTSLSAAPGAAVAATPELDLHENVLPPIGHTIFCQSYPIDCSKSAARASFFTVDPRLLYADLDAVNRQVNASIRPARATRNELFDDRWLLFPGFGNCSDYAVSKRHELLGHGWPSWALLLAEVVLKTGEHHLVLVANARGNSVVLDNLQLNVVPLTEATDYQWIRIESAEDPERWISIGLGHLKTRISRVKGLAAVSQ